MGYVENTSVFHYCLILKTAVWVKLAQPYEPIFSSLTLLMEALQATSAEPATILQSYNMKDEIIKQKIV